LKELNKLLEGLNQKISKAINMITEESDKEQTWESLLNVLIAKIGEVLSVRSVNVFFKLLILLVAGRRIELPTSGL